MVAADDVGHAQGRGSGIGRGDADRELRGARPKATIVSPMTSGVMPAARASSWRGPLDEKVRAQSEDDQSSCQSGPISDHDETSPARMSYISAAGMAAVTPIIDTGTPSVP